MGLSEHREDMDSLWSFVDKFMSGASRYFFTTLDLRSLPNFKVDVIAVLVGKMLRAYSCLWDMNKYIQVRNSNDFYVEELMPNGDWYDYRQWAFHLSDEGLVFIEEDGEEIKRDGVIVDELQKDDFRWRLANYVFSAWDMPITLGSLVGIGINECDFNFEEYSYNSVDRGTVRGIRCIDPNDKRCSYQFISQEGVSHDKDGYNCVLTGVWPPRDCAGSMWSRAVEEPLKVQSYFPSELYIDALGCLRRAVGRDDADFRDGQWEAIDGVLHNRRQLVVQRTGWGKSMIYFIASKFLREQRRGMTLLISPLLALMRNQVVAAERVGVRCYTINSTNPKEWDGIKAEILSDSADLLIVSPERLANDAFREEILEPITDRIGLLVIDEAHCVSDWGHDFRPDYKKISRLLAYLPPTVPVLATTATATDRVIDDIEAQLGGTVDISRGSLVRKSLYLQNIRLPSQEARLAWLAETLKTRIRGSGIVYALTIRDAEIVARWLRRNGIEAYAYSSNSLPPEDLDPDLREELEDIPEWADAGGNSARTSIYRRFLEDLLLENRVRALVATSALSMGFDKSDLAFVIHYQRPKSVVDYYQQVGRAGRGIDSAYGVLLNGEEDDQIADYFIRSAFPSEEMVETVLDAVAAAPKGLSIVELAKAINIRQSKIEKVLRFVMAETPQPVVKEGSRYRATPTINSYRLPVETIRRLTDIRRAECRQMDAYVKSSECLMQFLCKALESPMDDATCDRCANCRPDMRLPATVGSALEQAAADLLRKSHVPIAPRSRWVDAESAIRRFEWVRNTVIPPELRMEEGRSLSLYGAGEWGRLVQQGKYQARPPRFDDRLVEACAQMLREWVPEKRPRWIVPIPSRRNNALVGDFAERLARRLGMPCWRGLVKTMDTPPQKDMENSAFQQNNVIDAFAVEGAPPRGGCYLVDDMVDSRWTFTVAAAVLREAGVEFVVPLALADSLNEGE